MLLAVSALLISAAAAPAPPPVVATPYAVADPAKLAVAKRIAERQLPNGSYRQMMGGLLTTLQQNMVEQITLVPLRDFAKAAGLPDAKVAALGTTTAHDILAIIDPAAADRARLTLAAINGAMIDQLSAMEPTIREGIAIAYANRFTAAQLADIDAFFASPTGRVYGATALQLTADPAVTSRLQAMMKTMAAAMPETMRRASAATASLPPIRKATDLTPAEKARLATLLGVAPAALP